MKNLESLVAMKPEDRQKMEDRNAQVKLEIAIAKQKKEEAELVLKQQL